MTHQDWVRFYLKFMLASAFAGGVTGLFRMAIEEYPRIRIYQRIHDAWWAFLSLIYAAALGWLLWG